MTSQRVPVGIRFKDAGKIYYFDARDFDLTVGTRVVVDTSHGKEIGRVVIAPDQVIVSEIKESLKPILRLADQSDLERSEELKKKARDKFDVAKHRSIDEELQMRVVSGEYSLDGDLLTFYYTSEERVDFRSFAKDLTEEFDVKVQLLQVGERDRAKIIDGIGRCGERLCCSSWMTYFPTVSIKQAKEQDLPLNPSKLSGACGRLLCCLTYEYDQYKEIKGGLPKVGARISTPSGEARVRKINVPKESITLSVEGSSEDVEVPLTEFRLMYGTAMRPKELTDKFEKDLMAKDVAAGSEGETAATTTVERPLRERSRRRHGRDRDRSQRSGDRAEQPRQEQQQQPQASGDQKPRRRRRRGGRGRRRGGGGGAQGGNQGGNS